MSYTEPTKFSDQRIALIHTAIQEFTVTRPPESYGLYPILNLLILLVQKPLLLVVFKKPLIKVKPRFTTSDDCGWVHSMPYPLMLKEKFDDHICGLLRNVEESRHEWIVDLPEADCEWNGTWDGMHALGLLYMNLVYGPDNRSKVKRDNRPTKAGNGLSKETNLQFLNEADLNLVKGLFHSITHHESPEGSGRFPDLHNIDHYWQLTRSMKGSLFDVPQEEQNPNVTTLAPEELTESLKPLFQEIDSIYRELRGGTPGNLDLDTRAKGGTSLLWARHRESKEKGNGPRPLTIAFYIQVRAPVITNSQDKDAEPEQGYRIIPVVTKSMCEDIAAILIEHRKSRDNAPDVLAYLEQLGMDDPDDSLLDDPGRLAGRIFNTLKAETFLQWQYYHSMTYPAFASGTSMFSWVRPCSRCDRIACGPDFLKEEGGQDAVFMKPILISGFPYLTVLTRTRAPIGKDGPPTFSTFYFNYLFHIGIIRRWISRRLRGAMMNTYLQALEEVVLDTFKKGSVVPDEKERTYAVEIEEDWFDELDNGMDRVAQTMPYAKVKITLNAKEASKHIRSKDLDNNMFSILNQDIFFWMERNEYFHRKLIDNDLAYINNRKIKKTFEGAVNQLNDDWSRIAISVREAQKTGGSRH